jgi:hypothetical protein
MTDNRPVIGQRSPDGTSWWDGTGWRPLTPAGPVAAPPSVPPPPITGPPSVPPPRQPLPGMPPPPLPKPGPRRPPIAVAVLLMAVALACGGLVGGGGGALTAAGSVQPDGPSTPPVLPSQFPRASDRYLPAVKVADIADRWLKKANKWACEDQNQSGEKTISGADHTLECTPTDDLKYDVSVRIEYDGEDQVRYVNANCSFKPGSRMCHTLFATLTDVLFLNRPELRKEAMAWGDKHADSDETTAIGGIRLSANLSPHELTCVADT